MIHFYNKKNVSFLSKIQKEYVRVQTHIVRILNKRLFIKGMPRAMK
jgi:hypothetical protein